MARILVTGSKGTLGQPLCKELRGRGHEVWELDTHHSSTNLYQRCDIADYRQVRRAISTCQPEYVFHLAAEFGRINGEEYYEQVWQTNAIGTRNILEVQKDFGFKLIFASSSEIYGEQDDVLTESLPDRTPVLPSNDYAISKWVNELQCMNFEKRYGSEIVRLRFFNAYGPGEYYHAYRSVVCLFAYKALHDISFPVYRGYHRVFMYIDDFIPTLANVCDRFNAGQVYNIAGEEYRSVEELARLILHYTGKPETLMEIQSTDLHNVKNKMPDIRKATQDLGHMPTWTLEEGVPQTIDWMQSVYPMHVVNGSMQPATPYVR